MDGWKVSMLPFSVVDESADESAPGMKCVCILPHMC